MARTPLARRIARLTPVALAAAALAAPATAAAGVTYPTGDGLIGVSAGGSTTTVWPDGSNVVPGFAAGTVGTFDGSGNNLSLKTGNKIVSMFNLVQGRVLANVAYDLGPVGATAMNPAGSTVATIAGGSLRTYAGPGVWTEVAPAVGRFGWSTKSTNQRRVYVAGPGSVNGGGQDISGSIVIREADDATSIATMEPGAQNPTISPDGRWIAFEKANGDQRDVYLLDTTVDGAPFLAADQTGVDEYLPAFSPDSTRLVFARGKGDGSTDVREIPVGTIAVSRLVTTIASAPATGLAWQPSVKATAGTLAFSTLKPKAGTPVEWSGNANGGYKPMTETITWQRCTALPPESDGCTDITDGADYTPTASDVGFRLRLKRVVKNPAGTSTVYSDTSAVVTGLPAGKPVFTARPGELTNAEMPSFAWTAGENGGAEYECRVVAGWGDWYPDTGWTPCTSPTQTPPLTSGEYTFMVRHKGDGNDTAYHAFKVDQDPPAKPELIAQQVKGLTASVSFTSGSNEIVTFECRLDGEPEESASPWTPCPGAWSAGDLAEGPHRLDIRAIDKAGNRSAIVTGTWTNKKPAAPVEQPKPEPPAQPETPAVQTPAVETPAASVPKAETPKAETPKPAPAAPVTPVKPRALAVTIGGTTSGAQTPGGTAAAATIEVAKESVGVGCSITGTVLKSCKVDLYAPRAARARARAAAAEQVLVGTGTYESKNGSSKMDVRIELNATGKAMLRKSPGGLKVSVRITGKPVSGAPLKASGVANLVTDRASATVGGFAVNSPVLTAAAKRRLRTLAKFGKADTIRCVGHTDGSSDDESYLKGLGLERAKAVCAYLTAHGAKGARVIVSRGKAQPAATNATAAGQAKNRRVQVTLVR
ncbi:MAG TPA: OmpA family protein [Solirubrobacteraceae bacterium]|nr:OmpA family protein [Solirubrobacteraceae bacterium]